MAKFNAKDDEPIDVLVLGDHPAGHVAATLLRHAAKSPLRVLHAALPSDSSADRLVTLNPALFELHPSLAPLQQTLSLTGVRGLLFLADDAGTRSAFIARSPLVFTTRYRHLRDAFRALGDAAGVERAPPVAIRLDEVDETGLHVTIGKHQLRATALVVAGELPADQRALLGIAEAWGGDVLHRFAELRCRSTKHLSLPEAGAMPMSLDLRGQLCWGWLIPGDGEFQLAVEHPLNRQSQAQTLDLLRHWARVLQAHGVLADKFEIDPAAVTFAELPLAGALAHEGVGNRTLLVGPAGGFYSACGEEIYPGCWSAVYAAEVLRKALREPHLQDALNPYREKWRTTLGDYLRGPQQNLRFLLPLVYRNPVMTQRLAEAILLSKSVVR